MRSGHGGPRTDAVLAAGATKGYIAARQQLLQAERALLDQVGQVAELRRTLPRGAAVPDYAFAEGPMDLTRDDPVVTTRLADLVGDRSLVIYHMMYAPDWEEGCPSCSMWIDGLHGVSHHLAQLVDFAVIAKAPLPKLRAWARHRGWAACGCCPATTAPSTWTSARKTPTGASGPG